MLIELLPGWAVQSLPVIGMLFVGYVVERHYVSRVTCFTNALALTVYVLDLPNPSVLLTLYTEFGLAFGLLGMAAYLEGESLGDWFYLPAFMFYASLPVAAVILLPTPFLPTLFVAGLVNVGLGLIADGAGATVIYRGVLPATVVQFLDEHTVEMERYRDGMDLLVRL